MRIKEVVIGKERKISAKEGAMVERKRRVYSRHTIHPMRKEVTLTLILNQIDLCLFL